MTNTAGRDISNNMGCSPNGHNRVFRNGTNFQSISSRNRNGRSKDESCDQNRPKSTETVAYQVMPSNTTITNSNSTKQGSPRLKQRGGGSPSKERNQRFSPTLGGLYAAAKFSEPPEATSLPRPPSHWTSIISETNTMDNYLHTNQLKFLLKVQA